jgi:hypothetical protein
MALDFIGFINNNTPGLTAKQKADMLSDFCLRFSEIVPITTNLQKEFANERIQTFIVQAVHEVRRRRAQDAATYEELTL